MLQLKLATLLLAKRPSRRDCLQPELGFALLLPVLGYLVGSHVQLPQLDLCCQAELAD
jgi:hypothetical protein